MRALDTCLECGNAVEIITTDSVKIEEVVCSRLSRHWPACKMGENVFSKELSCDKMTAGLPAKVFPNLRII